MTDPYNSYPSHLPPPTKPAGTVQPNVQSPQCPKIDRIARLDVSDKWKGIFRAIEKAGGPKLPHIRELPFGERLGIK